METFKKGWNFHQNMDTINFLEDIAGHPIEYRPSSIMLVGPPGCGKGTQGGYLEQSGDYFNFSTGDMFRGLKRTLGNYPDLKERILADPALGEESLSTLFDIMSRRDLVPNDITIRLVQHHLNHYQKHGRDDYDKSGNLVANVRFDPSKHDLSWDGFSRNKGQIDAFMRMTDLTDVYVFMTPWNVCVDRQNERAVKQGRTLDTGSWNVLIRGLEVYAIDTYAGMLPELVARVDANVHYLDAEGKAPPEEIKETIRSLLPPTPAERRQLDHMEIPSWDSGFGSLFRR